MKLIKPGIFCISLYIYLTAAAASKFEHNQQASGYMLYAYKDCEVVKAIPLNREQIVAYEALQEEEQLMSKLEAPMAEFEEKMQHYAEQLEALDLTSTNQERTVIQLGGQALIEHQAIGLQMQKLVSDNQLHLDAIEQQGRYIAERAATLERSLNSSLDGLDYEWTSISSPDNPNRNWCNRKHQGKM